MKQNRNTHTLSILNSHIEKIFINLVSSTVVAVIHTIYSFLVLILLSTGFHGPLLDIGLSFRLPYFLVVCLVNIIQPTFLRFVHLDSSWCAICPTQLYFIRAILAMTSSICVLLLISTFSTWSLRLIPNLIRSMAPCVIIFAELMVRVTVSSSSSTYCSKVYTKSYSFHSVSRNRQYTETFLVGLIGIFHSLVCDSIPLLMSAVCFSLLNLIVSQINITYIFI